MFGIGIIGCGKITQIRHAPEYAENPGCALRAFSDMNAARAKQVAARYGADAHADWRELLKRGDVDCVSVCVMNANHAEVTVAALEAGKHVLCEKPMAVDLASCERMADAARANGRRLLIGHNQRLLRGHQFARDAIARGEIGRVLTFATSFGHAGPDTWSVDSGPGLWFFDPSRAAFGAMFDLGIHKMDLIQFLLADAPKSVWAAIGTLDKRGADGAPIAVEDNAICVLKMRSGAIGTLTASWTYYGREDNCTRVYGSEGQMRIYDDPDFSVVITKKSGEELCCRLDSIQTNVRQNRTGVIDDFIEAVETGRASVNDMENALSSMRSVFACLQSVRELREVEV